MGDLDGENLILSNLAKLTDKTVIGTEFVILLFQHKLISYTEKHYFMDPQISNVTKTFHLYTEIIKRWGPRQYKTFVGVLEKTEHIAALDVFLNNNNKAEVPKEDHPKLSAATNGCGVGRKGILNETKDKIASEVEGDVGPFVGVKELVKKMEEKGRVTEQKETHLKKVASNSEQVLKTSSTLESNSSNENTKSVEVLNDVAITKDLSCKGEVMDSSSKVTKGNTEPPLRPRPLLPLLPQSKLKNVDPKLLSAFVVNVGTAWKLVGSLSNEGIFNRIVNEATRVSDILGRSPYAVVVALGKEFVPRKQLTKFRGNLGDDEGKTVFEMKGRDFAVQYLWEDLVGEREEEGSRDGCSVRRTFGEALWRMGEKSWWLIEKLEIEVRKRRLCPRQNHTNKQDSSGRDAEHLPQKQQQHHRLMEWLTDGHEWNDSAAYYPIYALPLLLRYCGYIDPSRVKNLLQQNRGELQREFNLLALIRSLIISSCRQNDKYENTCFIQLSGFLQNNFQEIPPKFHRLADLFARATREKIWKATLLHHDSPLVMDISVWIVFLRLLPQSTPNVDKATWTFILSDVIHFTPCCDLHSVLNELKHRIQDEKMLKEILMSEDILRLWGLRFSKSSNDTCGVCSFLSFYFSVFRLNWAWMGTTLLKTIPLQIAAALQSEPNWNQHVLRQFQELLRQSVRHTKIDLSKEFMYKKEADWERLFRLVGPFQPGTTTIDGYIPTAVAAPLIRVLIKVSGVEEAKVRVSHLWKQIPSTAKYLSDSSVESLGSLLHSAIELDELTQVKKRAWPGLMSWRNGEGKAALDVAKEKFKPQHPILLHLNDLKRTLDQRH